MSLKSYCEENNRLRILREWDDEKNLPLTPDAVAHTSMTPVWWKCEKGHSWCTHRFAAAQEVPQAVRDATKSGWHASVSAAQRRREKISMTSVC